MPELSYITSKKILVTGGAGFIGSHLVDNLVNMGEDVRVLDNLSSGTLNNLRHSLDEIEFIEGDVRNAHQIPDILNGVSHIFHAAANASVPKSVKDPVYDFQVNTQGTFNLLKEARKQEIEKFIYFSSAAVYGTPEYVPIDEDHPVNPISPYGATKLSGEKMGFAFKETYGLPFVTARIFNVYGPRQRKYVMYDFLQKLEKTPSKLEVLGTGRQKRSFCYISDMIRALLLLIEKGEGVYNIGGKQPIEIGELAELMISEFASPTETEIHYTGSSWEGDIKELVADITRIQKDGFQLNVSLKEGIQKLIEWYNGEVTNEN